MEEGEGGDASTTATTTKAHTRNRSGSKSKGGSRDGSVGKKRGRVVGSKRGGGGAGAAPDPQAGKKRAQLVNELLQSERTHVHYLNTFITQFVIPLRDRKILSPEELHDILSNIELIRNWNVRFLQSLQALLDDDAGFGELFLEMLPLMRQLYAQYNENYTVALESYERAKKTKEFAHFVEKASKEKEEEQPGIAAKSFLSFLYLPIQRMIAYDSLLTNLTNETPEGHPDYIYLKEALAKLRDATGHAEKLANQRKNIDKVLQIQSLLIGDPTAGECPSLAQPHRRFVYEGEVAVVVGGGGMSGANKRESARRLILFNDILLCVQQKKKQKGEKSYKVDFLEPLGTLRVEDRECEESRYRFTLFSAAKEYTLQSEDKGYWIQLLRDTIHKRREGEDGPSRLPTHHRRTTSSDSFTTTTLTTQTSTTASSFIGGGIDGGENGNGDSGGALMTGVQFEQIIAWAKLPDAELVAAVRQLAASLIEHQLQQQQQGEGGEEKHTRKTTKQGAGGGVVSSKKGATSSKTNKTVGKLHKIQE
eukprot:TRINITY_DN4197_c0_g1_i1.p1 TRINITY_DN4197_c0_g1~~TRINITY_DN4197_c0_g1_i1.p1  ORF type:complete len:535 (-),score=129.86 TRINITY_DN4197_c0_g1_i1:1-1605(-)